MKLTIYKDETLTEVSRVAEADKLKIPYRVSVYIIKALDEVDLNNEDDVLHFITGSVDMIDKIIKATFAVTDDELECVETTELINLIKELVKWTVEKIKSLKGNEKNLMGME